LDDLYRQLTWAVARFNGRWLLSGVGTDSLLNAKDRGAER
jgi:hypothetical protein